MKTNMTYKRKLRNAVAFTLIEIVLVLAIIALLLGAAVYQLTGVFGTGQAGRVDADLQTFRVALTIYHTNAGTYPSTEQGLNALVEKPTSGRIPRKWKASLEGEVLDPWGNPYGYRFPPTKNKGRPDIWSFGEDMQDGTEDDIGNWNLE